MNRAWMMLVAMMVAACATTELKDTWKDAAFTGPPLKQVLVIGVSKSDANRRVFEDGFSAALKAAGTEGIASYPALSEGGAIPSERIDAAVKQTGADGVLVTRVLRVRQDVQVRPGYASPGFSGMGYRGYYRGAYVATAPEVDVYDVLTIESTLWSTRTDRPVWSGSEVTKPRSVAKATEELAKVLIARMKADGVI